MSHRHGISHTDFCRIEHFLPGRPGQQGGVARSGRFLDAVHWIARTGAAWADLPERLGNGNNRWRRFDRWAAKGRCDPILAELRDPDVDVLILDSTAVRAYPCAAGSKKWDGSGGQGEQALGRSRGGLGTKVHMSCDGLGHPVELILTAAQDSDIAQAEASLADHTLEVVIADKGYDKKALVEEIERGGGRAVIPTRKGCNEPRALDRHVYGERNLCEQFWSKANQYRRVATRYEKKAANYLAFVKVAAMMVMLQ